MKSPHRLNLHPLLIVGLAIMALAASCTRVAPTPSALSTAIPLSIECSTFYRSSVTVPIEQQEQVTLTAAEPTKQVPYDDLIFHATFVSGEQSYESRSLKTWVTATGSENELASTLYQWAKTAKPSNQFNGGEHGFTGLNYVYHPTSRAELQFWCTAR